VTDTPASKALEPAARIRRWRAAARRGTLVGAIPNAAYAKYPAIAREAVTEAVDAFLGSAGRRERRAAARDSPVVGAPAPTVLMSQWTAAGVCP